MSKRKNNQEESSEVKCLGCGNQHWQHQRTKKECKIDYNGQQVNALVSLCPKCSKESYVFIEDL